MTVELFQEGANLNVLECREFAMFLTPEDMRICTRVEEKESKEAEKQFFDPLVIPCGASRDFLEKFKVPVDATITFQCTLMKMPTAQKFNCLVTNNANRPYFACPGRKALADAYKMEAGERATFYLDYNRDEIMVYYNPVGSDDGALTPDYDRDFARRKVVVR
ncbi:hypothetical protein VPH35_041656 [Triticum aestivum]